MRSCSLAIAALVLACGCEPAGESTQPRTDQPPEQPSAWRIDGDSAQIALTDDIVDERLNDAIARAKASSAQAREQWLATSEVDRVNWAVKWAATTTEGSVEHLWVEPAHWSPFRIEGFLISQPVNQLPGDRRYQDLVSFPIEELSDWVFFIDGDPNGKRHGGFTIDALEEAFGPP